MTPMHEDHMSLEREDGSDEIEGQPQSQPSIPHSLPDDAVHTITIYHHFRSLGVPVRAISVGSCSIEFGSHAMASGRSPGNDKANASSTDAPRPRSYTERAIMEAKARGAGMNNTDHSGLRGRRS